MADRPQEKELYDEEWLRKTGQLFSSSCKMEKIPQSDMGEIEFFPMSYKLAKDLRYRGEL